MGQETDNKTTPTEPKDPIRESPAFIAMTKQIVEERAEKEALKAQIAELSKIKDQVAQAEEAAKRAKLEEEGKYQEALKLADVKVSEAESKAKEAERKALTAAARAELRASGLLDDAKKAPLIEAGALAMLPADATADALADWAKEMVTKYGGQASVTSSAGFGTAGIVPETGVSAYSASQLAALSASQNREDRLKALNYKQEVFRKTGSYPK